ncbi:enteropeptidase [Nephila pilipes]|uniref:Enteropeptidase n=1 Tax=Nephila pilipes TaxID=299642 RepID=A0A8X6TW11_NEPPI|nr:enteropeptidase [Nephila pilipes]
MNFGGLQCCISIFVFLNLQVIATGQDVGKNFSTTQLPTTEFNKTELPTMELNTTELPTTELPTTELNTTELPTTELTTTELTTTELPTTELNTTELPTTELNTTELPTTELPTTELPTTELPTTDVPMTELPTSELPTSEQNDFDNEDCMECGLGVIEREGRVVNGEEVRPLNKYPWIVPLNVGNRTVCGGALISRTFILTAAHCIFNALNSDFPECREYSPAKECYISEKEFSIYLLGSQRFGQKLEIKRFIPHDRYHHNLIINDIALIELAQPIKCSTETYPICLPTKEEMYKEDQKLFVAGWGWNTPWGDHSVPTLREGVMQQVSPHNCMLEGMPKKSVNQFHCAAGTTHSICVGDSGSSTFIKFKNRFYALGVTSNIQEDDFKIQCITSSFSTFTKVLYFSKWINTHVKNLPEP